MEYDDLEKFDVETIQDLLSEVEMFMKMKTYGFFKESFERLRDEARDVALDELPNDLKDAWNMVECKGGYRAFKRAAMFFDEFAAELNKQIENE